MSEIVYHLPTRPMGLIAAINHHAAATGSPRYAAAAENADYNGHHVTCAWNDYRKYYVAEYWWAGRVVLARGTAENCVRAAVEEYDRGALGASVTFGIREEDIAAVPPELLARLVPGEQPQGAAKWYCGWIEWCLKHYNTHLLIEIDGRDIPDAEKEEALKQRLFPKRA